VAPSPRLVGPPDPYATGATTPAIPSIAPNVGTEEVRAAAAAGDPVAAYEIANLYADGRGTLRDLGQAAAWYRRAADAGLVPAIYRLASFYERGQGVPKDLGRAMALYERAAEQGNPGAMYNLAVLLNAGAAGAPDPDGALRWFRAAAEHGVKDSQYNLGVIYSRGIGVAVDRREAYKWFAVAAASGDEDAAAQRDRLAAALDPNALSLARAASSAFRPKAPPPGAADVATAAPVVAADVDPPAAASGIAFESRQAMVRIAQELLAERGFDPGPVDGLEGPKTVQAVRAFQRSIGAASTGRIDEPLVVRLSQQIG
jgi:localization factor PodJL